MMAVWLWKLQHKPKLMALLDAALPPEDAVQIRCLRDFVVLSLFNSVFQLRCIVNVLAVHQFIGLSVVLLPVAMPGPT